MRTNDKVIRQKVYPTGQQLPVDFNKPDFNGSVHHKGYNVIYEKVYRCPCKGQGNANLSSCKNCGGSGFVWANPIQTKMIMTGITSEKRYQELGREDVGMMNVTAFETDKLSRMDRIILLDGTSEHTEVMFPTLRTDNSNLFIFTKYEIKYIDYIALYEGPNTKLKMLIEGADYSFTDNRLILDDQYNTLQDPSLTIRYGHSPIYYVWDIGRDTLQSTVNVGGKDQVISLPIHAVAKKAHLIKDSENFIGNRLFDNSWLPECADPGLDSFIRKLKYTSVQVIYDNLTSTQKVDLQTYIASLP